MARYSYAAARAVTSGSLGALYVRLVADASDMVLGFSKAKSAVNTGTVAINRNLAQISTQLSNLSAQFIGLGRAALAANTQMSGAIAASAAAAAAASAQMARQTAQMSVQTQAAAAGAAGAAATVGKAGAAAGVALGVVGLIGVNQYAKLEQAVMGAAAVLGDTNEQIRGEMEKTVREVGRKSINGAIEQAGALEILASAGYKAEDAMQLLRVADRFAIAGHMTLNKATDVLVNSMGSLGLKTGDVQKDFKEMTRIANALTMANRFGQGSVEEFADALTHGGAQAIKMANKQLEEGIALLAAYAEAGDKGATGGEHAFMAMRDIQRVATEFPDVWKNILGIEVFDEAAGNLRNIGDIFGEFQRKLMGMSDVDRRRTLSASGLQERAMKAMVTMLSQSDKIRGWMEELQNASGVMDQVANDRLNTFSNQMRITRNNLQDLVFTIGKALIPALKEINQVFQEAANAMNTNKENVEVLEFVFFSLGQAIKVVALGVAVVWAALRSLATLIAGNMVTSFEVLQIVIETVIKLFGIWFTAIKNNILGLIELAKTAAGVGDVLKAVFSRDFKGAKDAFVGMLRDAGGEVIKLNTNVVKSVADAADTVKGGAEKVDAMVLGMSKNTIEELKATWTGTADMAHKFFREYDKSTKGSFEETKKAAKETGKVVEKSMEQAADSAAVAFRVRLAQAQGKMNEFLQSSGLNADSTGRQLHSFLPRETQDRLDSFQKEQVAITRITELEAMRLKLNKEYRLEEDFGVSSLIKQQELLAKLYKIEGQRKVGLNPFEGIVSPEADQMMGIERQIEEQEYANKVLGELRNSEYYSNQQSQEMLTEMIEYHAKRRTQLQLEQARLALVSGTSIFESLTSIAKDLAGEQSGIYKSMFAASKAFAIADATVKISQGIAAAASLPFPANLGAMATVAAAAASIVSNIRATQMVFAEEDTRASGGPVVAGKTYLVGERGAEAFVPKQSGTIIPNDYLGSGGNVQMVVNNFAGVDVQTSEQDTQEGKRIEVNLRRITNELASGVRDGRGDFARTMEASYGLRRSGR